MDPNVDGSPLPSRQTSGADVNLVVPIESTKDLSKYRELFGGALEGIYRTSPEGKILDANQSLANIFGYGSPEELIRSITDTGQQLWFDPGERAAFLKLLDQREIVRGYECRNRRKDGTEIWISLNGHRIAAPDGRTLWYQGFIEDITERKRAEDELRASQRKLQENHQQFQTIANCIPDTIWSMDLSGRLTYVSPNVERTHGWTAAESLQLNRRDTTAPRQVERDDLFLKEELEKMLSPGYDRHKVITFESEQLRKDGTSFWAEVSLSFIWSEDGKPIGLTGVTRDITERKRLANDLSRSEAKFAAAFRSSPAPIAFTDLSEDERLIEVNEAWERATGYGRNEALGHSAVELGVVEASTYAQYVSRVRTEGRISNFEFQFHRKDGRTGSGLMSGELVTLDGKPYMLAATTDITELRQAEAERGRVLRESEQRFRGIFDSAYQLMGLLSLDGTLLEVNQTALTMVGARREDVVGKPFWETPWWSHSASLKQQLREMIARAAGGESQCGEMDGIAADGSVRKLEFTLKPVVDANGTVVLIIPEGRDVTAVKRLFASLQESEARFRRIFDLAPYSMAIHDQEGRILDANGKLCSAWRHNREELIGHFVSDFVELRQPGFRELPPDLDRRVLRAAQQAPLEVTVILPPSGLQRIVLLCAAAISLDGKPCIVTSTTDVTELRQVEQQFRQAQKMEAIGRLAGGVAHDFNNLLTVINGCGDLLLRRLSPEDPLRELVSSIRTAGERAAGLSRQLLTFSRKQLVQPRPVNLAGLVRDSRAILGRLVGEDVEMTMDLDPAAGLVMADPGQLDQVVMNLVVNARDAMPQGGRITLRISRLHLDRDSTASPAGQAPGEYVLLEVADTGMGISDEVQQRIFEPFFTTKGEVGGTGLGLATVHGIVQQAGGWINVESEVGRGTMFRIGLPALADAAEKVQVPQGESRKLEGRETILVVENDDEVRKLVLQALTSFGYRILPAKSGDEALAIVKKHTASIDLMLTDVLMPKMNGKQLADNVHSVLPNLGVLFMSGHTGEVTLGRGLLDPGTPCLHKPFTPEALGQHVRDALGETGLPRRILVVDDDAAIRTLFAAVLQEEGYEVVLAGDGAEAAKAFAGSSFNLVITDLSIPHPEEIEPIRGIRQRQPGLKVIVVSGAYGNEALAKVVGTLDADVYFQKPVGPGQLLTAVRELLY